MASVEKGTLTPPQWWVHLRETKRQFWKAERRAAWKDAKTQATEG